MTRAFAIGAPVVPSTTRPSTRPVPLWGDCGSPGASTCADSCGKHTITLVSPRPTVIRNAARCRATRRAISVLWSSAMIAAGFAPHPFISWRARVRTERAITGLVVLAVLRTGLGSGHITPAGFLQAARRFQVSTRFQSVGYRRQFSWRNSRFHTSTRVFAGVTPIVVSASQIGRRVSHARERPKCLERPGSSADEYAALDLSSVRERNVSVLCRVADSVGHPTVCRGVADSGWRDTSCGESFVMARSLMVARSSPWSCGLYRVGGCAARWLDSGVASFYEDSNAIGPSPKNSRARLGAVKAPPFGRPALRAAARP